MKRHDQLGDLASSFNQMTTSVQDTVRQVADRERLARELELAREIQESLLVLYSDGLVEGVDDDGEPFGYERLAELLSESSRLGGGELTAAVVGALERHVGDRPLTDDLTLVVVESGRGDEVDESS